MPLGKVADMLMYAPFVGVYEVTQEVRQKLTINAFFGSGGCYVHPCFDERIDFIKKTVPEDRTGDDWSIKVGELIASLQKGKDDLETFRNWIRTDSDGIFSILGDAGTGKSTFLNYVKWSQKDSDWRIIDLKRAIANIKLYSFEINMPQSTFVCLHGKVVSALIREFCNFLFPKSDMSQESHAMNRKAITSLLNRYDERIVDAVPLEKYARLYDDLRQIPFIETAPSADRDYCKECAKVISDYFQNAITDMKKNREGESACLRCVLTHLTIAIRCRLECSRKKIIVFDNIERFIGSDEIYNKELTNFLYDLRGYCDSSRLQFEEVETNTNKFAQNYQFVVSMRNTTARNHTPIETTDFRDHSIDLSNWFSIDEIIHSKLNWYKSQKIAIMSEEAETHLEYIMKDLGLANDETLRGLRPKLDLIFNHNKRLITAQLAQVLVEMPSEYYMKYATQFFPSRSNLGPRYSCTCFSYRSVIWRSVLDWLRQGDLFQKEVFANYETDIGRIANINFIYKILVVLHHFSVTTGGDELESRCTDRYMPFIDLIRQIYNESGDFTSRFFEEGFYAERERIIKLLYYLNYFSRRENNWFQFIDIQYNINEMNRKHVDSSEDLMRIIESAGDQISQLKIRITTAGKAYLGYVAPSFEFVSCMAGKRPLLSSLPTEEELEKQPIEEQTCYMLIRDVLLQIQKYIRDYASQRNNVNLLYQRTLGTLGETYPERLVKSAYGYLTNFLDALSRLVPVEKEIALKRKNELISWITTESQKLWKSVYPNS